jgi:hypothetical protein
MFKVISIKEIRRVDIPVEPMDLWMTMEIVWRIMLPQWIRPNKQEKGVGRGS